MKKAILVMFGLFLYSSVSLGGGSIGGGGGSVQLENQGFDLMKKTYVEENSYRRISARLSVDGIESLPVLVGDETFDLQKIENNIVDANLSREFIPLRGLSFGDGTGTLPAVIIEQ